VKVLRIDHVSVAVDELQPMLDLLGLFGLAVDWHEDLPDKGVRSTMVAAGNAHIEILEAVREDAPVAKFLASRGPGLHHVCLEVDDLDEAIRVFEERGLRRVEQEPRVDKVGRRVFLHPSSGRGVLIGVMERHGGAGAD
jgi:methylmalonyl-CoA/ethylmalonyl-CoA epimerase